MANSLTNKADYSGGSLVGGGLKTTPETYTTLANLIDPTKPDVRDLYVSTFGDQGITGFLDLTGAKKNAGTSDKVEWYEEGRLHSTVTGTIAAGAADGQGTFTITVGSVRKNDVILDTNGRRLVVVDPTSAQTNNLIAMDGATAVAAIGTAAEFAIIGNVYAQGTDNLAHSTRLVW